MFKYAVIACLMFPQPVLAHSWYPSECCSGSDCRPVGAGEVVETKGGYSIPAAHEFIPYGDKRVRPSKDGEFHRCTSGQKAENPTICLFIPLTS